MGELASFNTASGMDCMQFGRFNGLDMEFGAFQYRKRYGLHAMTVALSGTIGMFEFQYRKRYGLHAIFSG